jgi:hypothetical protein
MSVTPASFRQQFAEFADVGVYSDVKINLWISLSVNLLNGQRWGGPGALLDYATSLFVAHHLVLGARDAKTAIRAKGIPGQLLGLLTAKSVDKVAASYDGAAIALENMGFYGLSRYGLELLQLGRAMGSGGLQVC